MIHLNDMSVSNWVHNREGTLPSMDDSRDPSKDPESDVYPEVYVK
jgi:hypothetical protein